MFNKVQLSVQRKGYRTSKEFYFWRTYDQQEIDLIESDADGSLNAFEFKWGKKTPSVPVAFSKAYPKASFAVIKKDNYLGGFL